MGMWGDEMWDRESSEDAAADGRGGLRSGRWCVHTRQGFERRWEAEATGPCDCLDVGGVTARSGS